DREGRGAGAGGGRKGDGGPDVAVLYQGSTSLRVLLAAPSPEARYVAQLYHDLLGRGPDPGAAYWVQWLQAGAPRAEVAGGIWESAEHRGRQVDGLYATYLQRPADAPGRAASGAAPAAGAGGRRGTPA